MNESDQIHRFWLSGSSTEYVPSAPVQPGPFCMKNVSKVVSAVPGPGAGGRVHWACSAARVKERTISDREVNLGILHRSIQPHAEGGAPAGSLASVLRLRPNGK